jgi:putative transposase
MSRKTYVSDLSDAEWAALEPMFPAPNQRGRKRRHPWRELVNSILYVLRSGGIWRLLPHDLPPWKTVYHYWRLWRLNGTWEVINQRLRESLRLKMGRHAQPSAGVIDSQSVKTSTVGGERGFDGAKKVNGRKRHVLVDTVGLLLKVKVHRADIQDSDGVALLLTGLGNVFPHLQHVWVDGGYRKAAQEWITQHLSWTVQVVKHPRQPRGVWAAPDMGIDWDALLPKGFRGVLPRRWVVERTIAWLSFNRRLTRDYERLPETSEAFIYLAMSRLMLRRLAKLP